MRRVVTWAAGIVGIAALARLLRSRRHQAPAAEPTAPDPAAALRGKLAESRVEPEPQQSEPRPEPVATASSLDERRRHVHEQAQQAIDEMKDVP